MKGLFNWLGLLAMIVLLSCDNTAVNAAGITAPGQATSGYGSTANYICNGFTEGRVGPWYDPWSGTWCWYYIPAKLKNGTKAPVVIYLHGMMLMAPDIYMDHIEHLCRQGYIVLFPQINKGGIVGLATDNNQYKMMHRTIDSVNNALSKIGSKADRSNMVIFGHSLGGLIGLCWGDNEGDAKAPAVQRIVLADPCLYANIPAFVDAFVNVTELDFNAKARSTTVPAIILTGSDDTIALPETAYEAYDALVNAPSRVIYRYNTDTHGDKDLKADHMAPIDDDGWMPGWAMDMLGGDGEVDAFDYRVFWAALDAALDGKNTLAFDMGTWSDGVPVKTVTQLAPK
ncbi:MAG TPA: hypothetical protein PLM53_11465 [Spirochaetota bacterium]|nr:hypothetical protein [Spirochaetota bacterium]HPC41447.1 hypothetical protein [Spirochaetota bacterium]HQF09170.1 hypothetical protein [Spirochaetota bacterium]HQH97711.1 hypothetical protein [Spirochaetota bacterium]HQJ71414.1 hypothetical protein [Spirochaetota bacterium]